MENMPINKLEDLMLTMGEEIHRAYDRVVVRAGERIEEGVLKEAWKLATGRESRGACPCCGRDRGMPL